MLRLENLGTFGIPLTILALYLIIIMISRPRGIVLVLWLAGLACLVVSIAVSVMTLSRTYP
ncbi:MAG TPA: hypothetical protein VK755_16040 [Candidatus Acidoferrales bacterium]|jgi:hypothetical protein|nr:hypothetical protein [Candidatus Acidoferrales bacterium]